jgi:hypothetical protein
MKRVLILFVVGLLLPAAHVAAQTVPSLINYQGQVLGADGNPLATGDYTLTFQIFDTAEGGTLIWGPQVLDGAGGLGHGPKIPVVQGYFNVMLGPVDTAARPLSGAFQAAARFLEIKVGTNNPISPRQQVLSAPYALNAANAASAANVLAGGVNTPALTDGAVTTAKLSDSAVATTKLADSAVISAKLADSAVISAKLADGAVTGAKLSDGAVAGAKVVDGAISTAKLANGAVVAAKLDPTIGVWTQSGNNVFRSAGNVGIGTATPLTALQVAGDIQMGLGAGDYRRFQLGGGNSSGFLYGSFPASGDGVHLAYNHYYNAVGVSQPFNTGAPTARVTVGYGFVRLAISLANGAAPTLQRLLADGAGVTVNGTFNNVSDRNAKQDFSSVNPAAILDKVIGLPLSEWSYKEDPTTRHIGPVAQDFRSAFAIGTDERHIAPLDEGGVALAAIQGLNRKLEQELEQKDSEIAELKARLEKLEQHLKHAQ